MANNDTTYVDNQKPAVFAAWLNDVDLVIYRLLGNSSGPGGTGGAPTTAAQIIANLGVSTPTAVATAIAAAFAAPPALGSTTPAAVTATTVTATNGIVGRTTAAPAGTIGELLTAAATVNMTTTNVAQTVVTLPLTAGVWDVEGQIAYTNSVAGANQFEAAVNGTTNTLPAVPQYGFIQIAATATSAFVSAPKQRIVTAGGQNIYLVGQATFGSGTSSANGFICATRAA